LKIPGYTIDLEKASNSINENKYSFVALQIPEGLKNHISIFIDFLTKNTDAEFIVYENPCFGACDFVSSDLKDIGVDFAVQIGHTQIPCLADPMIPTIFINAESDLDLTFIIEKSISFFKGKKIGIVTTSQHVHNIEKIKNILIKKGFEPIVGQGDNRVELPGQILGCNFTSATSIAESVDEFVYVGSGNFHPLGLMLSCKKPVIVADPYENKIRYDELSDLKDSILRQRYGAIARSKGAKVFGILIGIKSGQQRMDLAIKIKEEIESKKKKSFFISSDFFNPKNLETFRDIDCFISTACPRIAIDDYMQYKTPILTPVELEILLGYKKWDDYKFDEILDS